MRVTLLGACALAIAGGVVLSTAATAADDATPKYTIKEVMKLAHKDGLMKKVASGDGSKEDAEKLLELYEAMAADKPPKGDEASWQASTAAIVAAAKDAVADKPGAGPALLKATNCAACHKLHKPS